MCSVPYSQQSDRSGNGPTIGREMDLHRSGYGPTIGREMDLHRSGNGPTCNFPTKLRSLDIFMAEYSALDIRITPARITSATEK